MAVADRYLVAIFLNVVFDWMYFYGLGTFAWHVRHIGSLWSKDAPNSMLVRSLVFIAYYIAFASIFVAATVHMDVRFNTPYYYNAYARFCRHWSAVFPVLWQAAFCAHTRSYQSCLYK